MPNKTSSVVHVIDEACIGCKQCDQVCPTGAIVTIDRLARVDESICTGCNRCIEACGDHEAIRPRYLQQDARWGLAVPTSPDEQARVSKICQAAYLPVEEVICMCTGTTAGEVATAIIRGANSPEDVAIMTSARGVCSIWCSSPTIRLFEAAGVTLERKPKDWRVYTKHTGLEVGIWNISDEVAQKYPEYRLAQNKERLKSGRLQVPLFADIEGKPS